MARVGQFGDCGLGVSSDQLCPRPAVAVGLTRAPRGATDFDGPAPDTGASDLIKPRRTNTSKSEAVNPRPSVAQSLIRNPTPRRPARTRFCSARSADRSAVNCARIQLTSSAVKRSRPSMRDLILPRKRWGGVSSPPAVTQEFCFKRGRASQQSPRFAATGLSRRQRTWRACRCPSPQDTAARSLARTPTARPEPCAPEGPGESLHP